MLDRDEQELEYWSQAAIEAMESSDQNALARLLERMPESVKAEAMGYASQYAEDFGDVLDSSTAGFERDRGTADAPEGRVSGFSPAGTENTLQVIVGEAPQFQWMPETVFHKQVFARFLEYIEAFPQSITKQLWQRAVLPPLRNTISQLFRSGGDGEWEPESDEWRAYKLNPPKEAGDIGGVSKSKLKQMGVRTLEYEGTYRRTLTRTTDLNTKGNIFRSFTPSSSTGGLGSFFPGRTVSSGWQFGFEYGIDQEWFARENRQRRGDDYEAEYPSSFEDDIEGKPFWFFPVAKSRAPKEIKNAHDIGSVIPSLTKGEFAKYIRRVFITSREALQIEAQNERIRAQNDQIDKHNLNLQANFGISGEEVKRRMKDHIPEIHVMEGFGDIKARPLWSFFKTERPIIRKFKERVKDNMLRAIASYLDEGQRVNWYGAKDSQGRLLTVGDRHFLGTGTDNIENLPKSLRGIFRATKTPSERAEVEDIMFRYREMRAMGAPTPGMRSDMEWMEHMLRNVRELGEGMSSEFDDVPF